MKVYHGSLSIVESPEIRKPQRRLDYGSGFYTTTSSQQAEKWVRRRMDEEKAEAGYVNEYEFLNQSLEGMKCLFFEGPTDEWVEFVQANRMNRQYEHDYDIVYGPVANDKVYASFSLYEGGFISKKTLIEELKTYKLVDQYLFHTERSLKLLKFLTHKEIHR